MFKKITSIEKIKAREILDSRGNPTVEVEVTIRGGLSASASVPSGASTGSREALELRDKDNNRYNGKGVLTAVNNVNTIINNKLKGIDVLNQELIDKTLIELDGTSNKSNLGANAILGVSLACFKCASMYLNNELYAYLGNNKIMPKCMMNILNGGMHSNNKLAFQEFMIVPSLEKYSDNLEMGVIIFNSLKNILKKKNLECGVGDEGGFAPLIDTTKEALELIKNAINDTKYVLGKDVFLALDVAASSFYKDGKYLLEGKSLTSEELYNYYTKLIDKYNIISIEDPFDENDCEGFKLITKNLGNKIMVVGDDLFVTNKKLLQMGIENKLANSILIKLNQIGTVSETLETIKLAKENNYNIIISHRSGETTDTYIADFAVGLGSNYIKTGSLSRGERIAKYNRLLRIEEELK